MIKLESLVKKFTLGDETITAVNHADLEIDRGEFVAITGPSGSGKSTLMNIIGLLDTADEGVYMLEGMDVTKLTDDRQAEIRNEKIGFIFQSFCLLQKHTALENVMVPLLYRGIGEKEAGERAKKILDIMKMGDRLKHLPNQLSGGQQQRVAIARALAGEPSLILADEPTGALDSRTGEELMNLLKQLNSVGQTIIMITHDEHIASRASRIVRIEDGILREEDRQ